MRIYIYVDDVRTSIPWNRLKDIDVVRAKSYQNAIEYLKDTKEKYDEIYIDLDHDLGEDKNGYDIAKWIVENNFPLAGFHIHSANPVGVYNIRQLLIHYGYKEV